MRRFSNYRPDTRLPFIGIIIFLPFLLFWRWVFKGEVLFWGASLLQFWPWHYLVKTSLLNGEWPLWNPLLGNGTPLLANLQSAVFYPLNIIFLFLPSVEHALTLSVILHLQLAGIFMYIYARSLGLQPFAATIAALAYMFNGYLIGRTQFVPMINTAAWFPLLLYFSDRIVVQKTGFNILWLALILAVQLLAGHAQLWFYGLWFIGAYTLFRSWQTIQKNGATANALTLTPSQPTIEPSQRKTPFISYRGFYLALLKPIWYLALAVGISLLLSAVQILPTAEFVSHSPRDAGVGRTFALTYSLWPWRLITLLSPNFFGHPAEGNFWGYANYWEDHAYAGVLPFMLALAATWHYLKWKIRFGHRQKTTLHLSNTQAQPLSVVPFFALLIPISLILALGWNTPIYLWVFDTIPGFNFFQGPARLLIWYAIAVAVLAGIGAQFFESTPTNRPNWRRLLAACVALTAGSFLAESYISGRSLTFLTATRSTGVLLILSIILLVIRPKKAEEISAKSTDSALTEELLPASGTSSTAQNSALPLTPAPWEGPSQREGPAQGEGKRRYEYRTSPRLGGIEGGQRSSNSTNLIPLSVAEGLRASFLREPFWQWAIVIFIAIDLLLVAWPLIPTLPSALFKQPIASAEFLKDQPNTSRFFVDDSFTYATLFDHYFQFEAFGPSQIEYWQGLKESLVPNFGVYAGLPSANNDDPLVIAEWQQLKKLLEKADVDQQVRLLSIMNVGYFIDITANAWPTLYSGEIFTIRSVPNTLPRAYFVSQAYYAKDNSEAIDRLLASDFDPHQKVVIISREFSEAANGNLVPIPTIEPVMVKELEAKQLQLEVNAPSSGFVVLIDTFYPGWQATVDDQAVDIWQANLAFRAVAVEAGQHKINFNYRPLSFTFGLWTSIATYLIIVGIMAMRRLKSKDL